MSLLQYTGKQQDQRRRARWHGYLAEVWLYLVVMLDRVCELYHVCVELGHILAVPFMNDFQHACGLPAGHKQQVTIAVYWQ